MARSPFAPVLPVVALPVPRPANHAEAVAHFERKRAALLESAAVSLALAETVRAADDLDACADLLEQVRATMAEVAKIDACRVPRAA